MHNVTGITATRRVGTAAVSRRAALTTVAAGVLTATMLSAPVAAQSKEPIRLGMLMTKVGATGLFAREQIRGAEMYIEEVNAAGGIDGRPIEIIFHDTEGKPDRAGTLFRRLAEEGVAAVIGPDSAYVTLGMQDVPAQSGVMSVAAPGLIELVTAENRKYMVSAWAAYSFLGSLAMAYHKAEFGITRVGMITTADGVGERIANTSIRIGEELGVEVIVTSQPSSDRDLLPSLTKLATAEPPIDSLYIFGSGPFANIAMNQSELVGLNVPIFYTGGNVIPALIEGLSPEASERLFFATAPSVAAMTLPDDDPAAKRVRAFYEAYAEKTGDQGSYPASVGYDMAHTVIDAIRNVGADREAISEYIWTKQSFDGVQGVHFDRTGGNAYGMEPDQMIIATIQDGNFVYAGHLRDSLEKVGLTAEVVERFMREEGIVLD